MADVAKYLVVGAAILAFATGAIAQVLALYHFIRFLGAQTPGQRWGRAALGPLLLVVTYGLSEAALRHRALFLRYEAVFIVIAVILFAVKFILDQTGGSVAT